MGHPQELLLSPPLLLASQRIWQQDLRASTRQEPPDAPQLLVHGVLVHAQPTFLRQMQQVTNSSSFNEFLLLAFADTRELQLLHFSLFLAIGNGLIITAVACDRHLHTPMYFFLLNLSLLDLGSISITVPKSMVNSLWDNRDISYSGCAAQIFRAVLRIPSEQGRHKAFSMCLPHLAVVSLFVSTAFFAYLKPPSISSSALDLMLAVLYSVVPPVLNPFIYSMRNKELRDALKKMIQWIQGHC
ncbi:olfactory receptor 14J1-like [Eudromia elegans]